MYGVRVLLDGSLEQRENAEAKGCPRPCPKGIKLTEGGAFKVLK